MENEKPKNEEKAEASSVLEEKKKEEGIISPIQPKHADQQLDFDRDARVLPVIRTLFELLVGLSEMYIGLPPKDVTSAEFKKRQRDIYIEVAEKLIKAMIENKVRQSEVNYCMRVALSAVEMPMQFAESVIKNEFERVMARSFGKEWLDEVEIADIEAALLKEDDIKNKNMDNENNVGENVGIPPEEMPVVSEENVSTDAASEELPVPPVAPEETPVDPDSANVDTPVVPEEGGEDKSSESLLGEGIENRDEKVLERVTPYIQGKKFEGKTLVHAQWNGDRLLVRDEEGVEYTIAGEELEKFLSE